MKIPKYVVDIIGRAEYFYDIGDCNPGYTIRIRKATPYTSAGTFRNEIDRLIKWAARNNAYTAVLRVPWETHYRYQYAIVTITDPVMQRIEKYIGTTSIHTK